MSVVQSTRPTVPTSLGPTPSSIPLPSVLFSDASATPDDIPEPDYFRDLHLDEIVSLIVAGRDEYRLRSYFHARVSDVALISYRQQVFRDLDNAALSGLIRAFADRMRAVRATMVRAAKAYYRYAGERWLLDAADTYIDAVSDLARGLAQLGPGSTALRSISDYIATYVASDPFTRFDREMHGVIEDLGSVRYRLHISGSRIRVSPVDPAEPDHGAEVEEAFAKFQQEAAKDYEFRSASSFDMNHVEAAILDLVARLWPEVFARLDAFATSYRDFLDPTVVRFDREIQFYLGYLDAMTRIVTPGLSFCLPAVTPGATHVSGEGTFDVALAAKLRSEGARPVPNDFRLDDPERILVVSGPNSGGKTTFARTIGQMHHLAALGCPVAGVRADLALVDDIYTHFERMETLEDLTGKLEDDLRRIRAILDRATRDSLLIMNESFASTSLDDALYLNREVMSVIIGRGSICVVVTFLDELSRLGEAVVSMVGGVDPADPATRTFRFDRRPADGLAFAVAIADKYRLTYDAVKRRISR